MTTTSRRAVFSGANGNLGSAKVGVVVLVPEFVATVGDDVLAVLNTDAGVEVTPSHRGCPLVPSNGQIVGHLVCAIEHAMKPLPLIPDGVLGRLVERQQVVRLAADERCGSGSARHSRWRPPTPRCPARWSSGSRFSACSADKAASGCSGQRSRGSSGRCLGRRIAASRPAFDRRPWPAPGKRGVLRLGEYIARIETRSTPKRKRVRRISMVTTE